MRGAEGEEQAAMLLGRRDSGISMVEHLHLHCIALHLNKLELYPSCLTHSTGSFSQRFSGLAYIDRPKLNRVRA